MSGPSMKAEGDPNTPMTVVVGVVGTIVVFVIIVLLSALYHTVENRWVEKRVVNQAPEALVQLRAKQSEELQSYGWVSREQGSVTVAIDRAMELVVRDRNTPGAQRIPAAPAAPSSSDAPAGTDTPDTLDVSGTPDVPGNGDTGETGGEGP